MNNGHLLPYDTPRYMKTNQLGSAKAQGDRTLISIHGQLE